MEDMTPEQKQALEALVDKRIREREQAKKKAQSEIGWKSWSGIVVILLTIAMQFAGASPIVVLIMFLLSGFLIYSDVRDKL